MEKVVYMVNEIERMLGISKTKGVYEDLIREFLR